MVKDAEANADSDKKNLKIEIETMLTQLFIVRKSLKDHGAKIPGKIKKKLKNLWKN